MFNGYLIKIDGTEIPKKYIDTKTFVITPNRRRIIRDYYDGAGIRHVVYANHRSTGIEFGTNGLKMAAMRAFLDLIPADTGLTVEYYNDKTDSYIVGTFRLENDIQFGKYKIRSDDIFYKAVNITLTED